MKYLLVLLASLLAACTPITYLEPSGPGTQHDSWCGGNILDTMTISLPEFDSKVFVSTLFRNGSGSGWLEFSFDSLRDLDLQILSSEIEVNTRGLGRTEAHLAYAGRSNSWTPIPGMRQTTVDDQPVIGATVRAFGDLHFNLVFEVPASALPADIAFPHVALGGRTVSVSPIRLERRDSFLFGLCGV